MKQVPELLQEPVAVFDSATRAGTIVLSLLCVDDDGNPIIVAVEPNTKAPVGGKEVDVNFILSIYGKQNFAAFAEKLSDSDSVLYIDQEKRQELERFAGFQFPRGYTNLADKEIVHPPAFRD